jgi:hypothetical protein
MVDAYISFGCKELLGSCRRRTDGLVGMQRGLNCGGAGARDGRSRSGELALF